MSEIESSYSSDSYTYRHRKGSDKTSNRPKETKPGDDLSFEQQPSLQEEQKQGNRRSILGPGPFYDHKKHKDFIFNTLKNTKFEFYDDKQ